MRYHKTHLTRRLILETSADSEKEENMVEWLRVSTLHRLPHFNYIRTYITSHTHTHTQHHNTHTTHTHNTHTHTHTHTHTCTGFKMV